MIIYSISIEIIYTYYAIVVVRTAVSTLANFIDLCIIFDKNICIFFLVFNGLFGVCLKFISDNCLEIKRRSN